MKTLLLLLISFISCTCIFASNIHGTVTDEKGEALSFVSIYIQGTSIGTTTNIDGKYSLKLDSGTYKLVFQYIGYESKIETISLRTEDLVHNISLEPVSNNLQEIVVTAGEDPAYRIIRKAIKKRKFYLNQLKEYSCDTYVKGTQHIKNLPKSVSFCMK